MKKLLTLLPSALVMCGISCTSISDESLTSEEKFDKALGIYAQGLLAFEENPQEGVELLLHAVTLEPQYRHFIDDYLKYLEKKILQETSLSDNTSEFEKKHKSILNNLLPVFDKNPNSYYLQMKIVDSCLQIENFKLAERLLHEKSNNENPYYLLSQLKFYRFTDKKKMRLVLETAGGQSYKNNFALQHQAMLIYLGFNNPQDQLKILYHTMQLIKLLPGLPKSFQPPHLSKDLINGILYGNDLGEGARAQCLQDFYSVNRNSQWSLLAGILMKLDCYDAAYIVIKEKVLGKTGKQWRALYNLARCARMTGRTSERINYLEQALRLKPDQSFLKKQLIAAHTVSGNPHRALELTESAIQNDPWLVKLRFYNLKKLSRMTSAFKHAERIYSWPDPAEKIKAVTPYFTKECIEVYLAVGLPELLIIRLREALKFNFKDDNLKNSVVYLLVENGVIIPWLEELIVEIIREQPQNSSYLDTYAWLRYKQKKYGQAMRLITKAVQHSNSDSAMILLHAGDIYHAAGDYKRAVKFWKKALQTDKDLSDKINTRLKNENFTD